MTAKQLFEAVGLVDDDLILAAGAPPRRRPALRWQWVPLAACLCLAVGVWQSDGDLLGWAAGLVMPGYGAAAPESTAATASESAPETAADTYAAEAAGDESAGAASRPETETAREGLPLTGSAGEADTQEKAEDTGEACPIDAAGRDAWVMVDVNDLCGEPMVLPAGTLCILTDGGAPFAAPEQADELPTLRLTFAEAVSAEAGWADEGGAPQMQYQGEALECSLTMPEDTAGGYFYLIPESDTAVTAQPATAVVCR